MSLETVPVLCHKNAAHTAAMNLMIYPLGCLRLLGLVIDSGEIRERPGTAGWYPSLVRDFQYSTKVGGSGRQSTRGGCANTGAFTQKPPASCRPDYRPLGTRGWIAPFFLRWCLHGHYRDNPDRRHGRALARYLPIGSWVALPLSLRQLGLGWRLPGSG